MLHALTAVEDKAFFVKNLTELFFGLTDKTGYGVKPSAMLRAHRHGVHRARIDIVYTSGTLLARLALNQTTGDGDTQRPI